MQNNDLLYVTSGYGKIFVWDLHSKYLINIINVINSEELYNIIKYNEKYLLTCNIYGCIFVIDINQNKVISKFNTKESFGLISLKKLIHPKYGESILSVGRNDSIKLWTTNFIYSH